MTERLNLLPHALEAAAVEDEAERTAVDAERLRDREAARDRLAQYLANVTPAQIAGRLIFVACSADERVQGVVIDGVGLVLAVLERPDGHKYVAWYGLDDGRAVPLRCFNPTDPAASATARFIGSGLADLGRALRDSEFRAEDGRTYLPGEGWKA